MQAKISLLGSIRRWILFFILALTMSGVTAFFLKTELGWLHRLFENTATPLSKWINLVYTALNQTSQIYPFLAYGYDWLAFAHLVIAVAFFGAYRDPLRNKWIIQFGRIACLMIFPLAFIAGYLRGIPFYWQLIDCSFGLLGLIPLTICYVKIERLEKM